MLAGQVSTSFASFDMHKLPLLPLLRQQIVSADARRRIPVVAGLAEALMNGLDDPPLDDEPPGSWSTCARISPLAQTGPSFCRHKTTLYKLPVRSQALTR